MYKHYGKRIFDFLVSLTALSIFAPLLGIIALAVAYKLGRPIIFKQKRPGLENKAFTIYKFRTMLNRSNVDGLLPDAERLTAFGRFLRVTSLDELPELFNVLKGDMSLVGPRPLLMEYLELYTDEQLRRHDIKPGITGWAQVNGRNKLSWHKKFEYDLWYIDNMSLMLDLKILAVTIIKVMKRENISEEGQETMSKFQGD